MTSDGEDRLDGGGALPPDGSQQPEEVVEDPNEGVSAGQDDEGKPSRRKILIGSQRNPDAYRPKPKRDWEPVVEPRAGASGADGGAATAPPSGSPAPVESQGPLEPPPEAAPASGQGETPSTGVGPAAAASSSYPPEIPQEADKEPTIQDEPAQASEMHESFTERDGATLGGSEAKAFPPPNIRGRLSADLEEELQEALEGVELDSLIAQGESVTKQTRLESDTRCKGRIVMIRRQDAFVDLGGREQGILSLEQFETPPEIGAELEVRVVRFNREDGLYELSLPHGAAAVQDWSDLEEGMVVEARVTGHNSGGLECEVNHIRGFIPISQISLYRVEHIEEMVGEKLRCVVTEANPRRNNLVLSRRALLEREREEARKKLLETLEPGQIHEGTVRKLMDFGAFVELGSGVDGLLHVSELGWGRINHPSEVLSEGQAIKVKIKKYDPASGRISLAYRDMLPDPWEEVESKYPQGTQVEGKVTKLMEFGAFVELEPGVEGLVHISELSHKKIWRVSDVVKEGEAVDVLVQSVDRTSRRISLSMKDLMPAPEGEKKEKTDEEPSEPAGKSKVPRSAKKPLKGGLGSSSEGDKFGLKW